MKSPNRVLLMGALLSVLLLGSCKKLMDDTGSSLRILPSQMLSANIDANGNMYFMPQMLMAEGGKPFHTYSWSIDVSSNPPSGVSLGPIDGIVTRSATSGTGFSSGTFSFKVKVSDGNSQSTGSVGLHITNYSISPVADVQQLPVNEFQLMDGRANKAYCASLFVMGGSPPYTWAIDSGSSSNAILESYGLNLDPLYGLISGTILNSAPQTDLAFKVVIRDSKGKVALFNPTYKIHIGQ